MPCMPGKQYTKVQINKTKPRKQYKTKHKITNPDPNNNISTLINDYMDTNTDTILNAHLRQYFYMDFGVLYGSQCKHKTKDHCTVTSIDGKNIYIIIGRKIQ